MTRQEAIQICRKYALAAGEKGQHDYLPKNKIEADSWQPHEWILAAILEAEFKGSVK